MLGEAILVGRLVNDPQPFTANGRECVGFRLAVNHFGSEKGNFFDIKAADKMAEVCSKFRKGHLVALTCRIVQNSVEYRGVHWTNPNKKDQPVRYSEVSFWVTGVNTLALGLNRLYVSGRLTADPELRYTPDGRAVATGHIAVNYGEETTFVPYVAWGRQAEALTNNKSKGDPVVMVGYHKQREWEDQNGQRRRVDELICTQILFLPTPTRQNDETPAPTNDQPAAVNTNEPIDSEIDPELAAVLGWE